MKLTVRTLALIFAVALVTVMRSAAQQPHPLDVDVHYTYLHTNVLPGCNCFSLQGGGGAVNYGIRPNLLAVVDIDVTHGGSVTPNDYDLTLSTYTAGLRYRLNRHGLHVVPFGEFLVGASHASGSLAPGNSGLPGSPTSFALRTGGGLDLPLSHRFSVRLIQADYLMTNFTNGADNRQNNVQIGAGVVIHLRRSGS